MLFMHFMFKFMSKHFLFLFDFVNDCFNRFVFLKERMLSLDVRTKCSNHFVMLKELLPSFESQHSLIIFII